MEHLEVVKSEPRAIRNLRRNWWAASLLCLGEFLFTIYVLIKFPLPDISRIALGCVLLALPAMWSQSLGQFRELLAGLESGQDLRLPIKLFVLSVSRPCGFLTILLLAIAYASRFRGV